MTESRLNLVVCVCTVVLTGVCSDTVLGTGRSGCYLALILVTESSNGLGVCMSIIVITCVSLNTVLGASGICGDLTLVPIVADGGNGFGVCMSVIVITYVSLNTVYGTGGICGDLAVVPVVTESVSKLFITYGTVLCSGTGCLCAGRMAERVNVSIYVSVAAVAGVSSVALLGTGRSGDYGCVGVTGSANRYCIARKLNVAESTVDYVIVRAVYSTGSVNVVLYDNTAVDMSYVLGDCELCRNVNDSIVTAYRAALHNDSACACGLSIGDINTENDGSSEALAVDKSVVDECELGEAVVLLGGCRICSNGNGLFANAEAVCLISLCAVGPRVVVAVSKRNNYGVSSCVHLYVAGYGVEVAVCYGVGLLRTVVCEFRGISLGNSNRIGINLNDNVCARAVPVICACDEVSDCVSSNRKSGKIGYNSKAVIVYVVCNCSEACG